MRSMWRWLRAIMVSWITDVDARVKSSLEDQKADLDREIEQIGEEGRRLDGDIRTFEEEAATLHKQRVRNMYNDARCIPTSWRCYSDDLGFFHFPLTGDLVLPMWLQRVQVFLIKRPVLCKQEEIFNKVKVEKKKRADMTSRIGKYRFLRIELSIEP